MRDGGFVLFVDREWDALVTFDEALRDNGSVVVCTDFATARKRLLEDDPPQVLVTNLRLEAYNGLHLVYVATSLGLGIRCIVYSDQEDALLMREARSAGAAYESKLRIPDILAAYASAKPTLCLEPRPPSIQRLQPSHRRRRSASLRG
jgi:DNA-binding NtrC family response regulator